LEIDERGAWKDPDHIPVDAPNRAEVIVQQDEEIFQTARLINCGWFRSVVLSDYLLAILGSVRQGNAWSLYPYTEFKGKDRSTFVRGGGNLRSVEVRMVVVVYFRLLTTRSTTVYTVGTLPPPRRTSDGLSD